MQFTCASVFIVQRLFIVDDKRIGWNFFLASCRQCVQFVKPLSSVSEVLDGEKKFCNYWDESQNADNFHIKCFLSFFVGNIFYKQFDHVGLNFLILQLPIFYLIFLNKQIYYWCLTLFERNNIIIFRFGIPTFNFYTCSLKIFLYFFFK